MIIKENEVPLKVEKLKALLRRLPNNHPKRSLVEKEFAMRMAGYKGEKSLDYFLSFLNEDYHIFHGLRLQDKKYFFQIDTLILTSHYIIILEVKNMTGTLIFDQTFDQLIRVINREEEGFQNPVKQVKHQEFQLRRWLKTHNFQDIPIESFVIISNPNTIIKVTGENPSSKSKLNVIKSQNILSEIEKLNEIYQTQTDHHGFKKDMTELSKRLVTSHTPYESDILDEFTISKSDLVTGVLCEHCTFIPMDRSKGKWKCPDCHFTSKQAHISAIKDYFLLIDRFLTNKQFRDFTHLTSRTASYKLLSAINFRVSGSTCDRRYHFSLNHLKKLS